MQIDDDPSVIVIYASDDDIHQCLTLPGFGGIPIHPNIPALVPQMAAVQSARHFKGWVDAVFQVFSPHCTRTINTVTGLPMPGHYAGLWGPEWEVIADFLAMPVAWVAAINNAGLSCGSVTVAFGRVGRDCSSLVIRHVGPFRTL